MRVVQRTSVTYFVFHYNGIFTWVAFHLNPATCPNPTHRLTHNPVGWPISTHRVMGFGWGQPNPPEAGLGPGWAGSPGGYAMSTYTDSAYMNSVRNWLTTGFIFMISDTSISWMSRKQLITAQSSTEVKYMAVLEAAKQAIWARHFLYAIGKESIYHKALTIIYEDNQRVIKITDNPINHLKTKHIAVQYHVIQDHISNGEVRLKHLATNQMIADGLMKATNHISQGQLVEDLGLA